jgi:plastocyanin
MKNKNIRKWSGAFVLGFILITTGFVIENNQSGDDGWINASYTHKMENNETLNESQQGRTVTVEPGDTLEVRSEGSDLSYDITEIRAKAGTELTIRYVNESTMPHNVVFVTGESDINDVGIAALQAHQNEYIPENMMEKIFGYTTLVVPGEIAEVTITVPEPGTYPYICTYPGHFTMMQGRLISRE